MAKARSTEAKLARLRELRGQPGSPQLLDELRGALRDASNFVAEAAAEIAEKALLTDLVPDLVEAFKRFLVKPEKSDKLCRAKIAIVAALNTMEFADESFFLAGIHYVQPEPVWGKTEDSAVPVRVECVMGLVRVRHPGVLALLVDMLTDQEKMARVGAAQALAYSGTAAASLLLRLKARLGDREPDVISECFAGVLYLTPEEGVSFVAEFLTSGDEAIQERCATSGSGRRLAPRGVGRAEGLCVQKHDGDLRDIAHMAMALMRQYQGRQDITSLTCLSDPSRAVALSATRRPDRAALRPARLRTRGRRRRSARR